MVYHFCHCFIVNVSNCQTGAWPFGGMEVLPATMKHEGIKNVTVTVSWFMNDATSNFTALKSTAALTFPHHCNAYHTGCRLLSSYYSRWISKDSSNQRLWIGNDVAFTNSSTQIHGVKWRKLQRFARRPKTCEASPEWLTSQSIAYITMGACNSDLNNKPIDKLLGTLTKSIWFASNTKNTVTMTYCYIATFNPMRVSFIQLSSSHGKTSCVQMKSMPFTH